MKKHKHVIASMEYRGKVDSVYVKCHCGFEDCLADWYCKCPPAWNKDYWTLTLATIKIFLQVAHNGRDNG